MSVTIKPIRQRKPNPIVRRCCLVLVGLEYILEGLTCDHIVIRNVQLSPSGGASFDKVVRKWHPSYWLGFIRCFWLNDRFGSAYYPSRKWRIIPRLRYTNFKKEYPNFSADTKWFSVHRFWIGRIITIEIKHHSITLDFRHSWLADMMDTGSAPVAVRREPRCGKATHVMNGSREGRCPNGTHVLQ